MKLLLFDTETTGLPKTRDNATRGADNWPHLVSIAWIVIENNEILKSEYHIVNPEWGIPEESTKIHGITYEQAAAEGEPLKDIIQKFLNEPHDMLVAHNLNFDLNVIINAILWDLNMPYPVFKTSFCTMEAGRILCRLPLGNGRSGYKYPKLSELYEFVTKRPPATNKLHNSLYDTQLLAEIVMKSTVLRPMMGLPAIPGTNNNVRSQQPDRLEI